MIFSTKIKTVLIAVLCALTACFFGMGILSMTNGARAQVDNEIVFIADNNAKNESVVIPKNSDNWSNTVVTTEDGFMNVAPKFMDNGYETGLLVKSTDLSAFDVSVYPILKIRMKRTLGTWDASDFDTNKTWQAVPYINLRLVKSDGTRASWEISKLSAVNDSWAEFIIDLSKDDKDASAVKYVIDGLAEETAIKYDYSSGSLTGTFESFEIKPFTYNQENMDIERSAIIEYFGFFKTYDDAKNYSVNRTARLQKAKTELSDAEFSMEYIQGKTEDLAIPNAMSAISAVAGVGVKGVNPTYLVSNDKEEGFVRFEKVELASGGEKTEVNDLIVVIKKPYDPVVWTYTTEQDLVGMEQWDLKTMEIKDNALHIVKKTPKEEDGFDFTVDMAEGNPESDKRQSFQMEHYGYLKFMFKVVGQGRLQFYHFNTDNDANGKVTRQYGSNSRSFVVGWEEDTWLSVIVDFSKTYNAVTVENMQTGEIEIYDVYGDNYRKDFTPVPFEGLSERFRFNFGRRNNLEREAYIKYIAFFPSMEQALAYESDTEAFKIDATLNMQNATFTSKYEDGNSLTKAITVAKEQIINTVGVNAQVTLNVTEYVEPLIDCVGVLKFGATVSYNGSEFTFNGLEMDISAESEITTTAWFFNNEKVVDHIETFIGGKVAFNGEALEFTTKINSGFALTGIEERFFAENYKNICLGIKSSNAGTINVRIETDQGSFKIPVSFEGSSFIKKCYGNLEDVKGRVTSVAIEDSKSLQLSYIAFITGDRFDGHNFYSSELVGSINSIPTTINAKYYQCKTEDMAKQAIIDGVSDYLEQDVLIDSVSTVKFEKATTEKDGVFIATVKFSTDSVLNKGFAEINFTVNIGKITNNDILYDFSNPEIAKRVSGQYNSDNTGNFIRDEENGQIVMKTDDLNTANGIGFQFGIKNAEGNPISVDVQEYNYIKLGFTRDGYGLNSSTNKNNYTGRVEIIFFRTNDNGSWVDLFTCSFELSVYNHLGVYLCAFLDIANKTAVIFNPETDEIITSTTLSLSKTSNYDTYNGIATQMRVTLARGVTQHGASSYKAPEATCKYFGAFNDLADALAFKGEMSVKATTLDGNNFVKTEKVIENANAVDTLIKINRQTLDSDGLILSYGGVQLFATTVGSAIVKFDGQNIIEMQNAELTNGLYRHIVLFENGGKIALYIDGVKVGEHTGSFNNSEILVGGISARENNVKGSCGYIRAWKGVSVDDICAYAYNLDITAVSGLLGGWRLLDDNFNQKGVVSSSGTAKVVNIYGRLGHEFIGEDYLKTEKAIDFTVRTIETWIKINDKDAGKAMTVFANSGTGKLSLEILADGKLKLSYGSGFVTTTDYTVVGKGWVLVSIVIKDGATDIYINGELLESLGGLDLTSVATSSLAFGYDLSTQSGYMTGFIGETRIWETERTAEQILELRDGYALGTETGLRRCYRFETSKNLIYTDYSSDKADATIYSSGWFRTNMADYDHTIIIVGDTQNHIVEDPTKNDIIYNWILENKDEENIGFVMQAGDFTQNCTDLEMSYAYNSISILNEVIPFVVTMGNHDYPSLTNKGAEIRDSSIFNKYMDYDYYSTLPNFGGTFEKGKMENVYMFFETGNIEWMIMVVEFAPRDEVIEWADYVISQYPDKNVIILTHSIGAMKALNDKGEEVTISGTSSRLDEAEYKLGGEGMHLEAAGTGVATQPMETVNEGLDIWTKLGKRHQNVVQIVSGHTQASTQMRVEEGENGNIVNFVHHDMSTTIKESGDWSKEAMIAIMKFDENGTACVYQYNPERNAYYKTNFFYSYQLDLI